MIEIDVYGNQTHQSGEEPLKLMVLCVLSD